MTRHYPSPNDLERDRLLHAVPAIETCKLLPPCLLYARIGDGGSGSVYLARHLRLEVDVAVKCLALPHGRNSEKVIARFQQEARLAAGIDHPNLLRVYDVLDKYGLNYIVMEYVHGETARDRVQRRGPAPIAEAAKIVGAIAEALIVAHATGIVHRDVKPDNVLISADGRVKLADLGVAKVSGVRDGLSTLQDTWLGTPGYMAPEQWEDARSVGPAADVYALGATMFFLLTGEEPIGDGTVAELQQRALTTRYLDVVALRPEIPSALARLVAKSTLRDPRERIADVTSFLELLAPALQPVELTDPRAAPNPAIKEAKPSYRTVLMARRRLDAGEAARPTVAGRPLARKTTAQPTLLVEGLEGRQRRSRGPWIAIGAAVFAVPFGLLAWTTFADEGRQAPPIVDPLQELPPGLDPKAYAAGQEELTALGKDLEAFRSALAAARFDDAQNALGRIGQRPQQHAALNVDFAELQRSLTSAKAMAGDARAFVAALERFDLETARAALGRIENDPRRGQVDLAKMRTELARAEQAFADAVEAAERLRSADPTAAGARESMDQVAEQCREQPQLCAAAGLDDALARAKRDWGDAEAEVTAKLNEVEEKIGSADLATSAGMLRELFAQREALETFEQVSRGEELRNDLLHSIESQSRELNDGVAGLRALAALDGVGEHAWTSATRGRLDGVADRLTDGADSGLESASVDQLQSYAGTLVAWEALAPEARFAARRNRVRKSYLAAAQKHVEDAGDGPFDRLDRLSEVVDLAQLDTSALGDREISHEERDKTPTMRALEKMSAAEFEGLKSHAAGLASLEERLDFLERLTESADAEGPFAEQLDEIWDEAFAQIEENASEGSLHAKYRDLDKLRDWSEGLASDEYRDQAEANVAEYDRKLQGFILKECEEAMRLTEKGKFSDAGKVLKKLEAANKYDIGLFVMTRRADWMLAKAESKIDNNASKFTPVVRAYREVVLREGDYELPGVPSAKAQAAAGLATQALRVHRAYRQVVGHNPGARVNTLTADIMQEHAEHARLGRDTLIKLRARPKVEQMIRDIEKDFRAEGLH